MATYFAGRQFERHMLLDVVRVKKMGLTDPLLMPTKVTGQVLLTKIEGRENIGVTMPPPGGNLSTAIRYLLCLAYTVSSPPSVSVLASRVFRPLGGGLRF